ncbi:MAG: glutamate-5-semialdehyde dehydrogenase, partial [Dehalococcoidia bacterium]|nr:glutamate-5-semialdehyde dehydrogenase [Dehalococcoidia bacterium]
MQSPAMELEIQGKAAKAAARALARLSTDVKNKALHNLANGLTARAQDILGANRLDCDEARAGGMGAAMLDRLVLNADRLADMGRDVLTVAALPDPVGESFDARILPNGLQISRRRVPLGVIGAIYESRPNVTVDISSLCLKSGNAVILRGGKETLHSNAALVKVIQEAIAQAGVPGTAVQFVDSPDRNLVNQMLSMRDHIDLIIPRGGADLIRFVVENACMPVVTGGIGVCHTYVDASADQAKAVGIVYNAKVQRPTVCNALD